MDAKEIKEVLTLHQVWIGSDGEKGKKVILRGADLYKANLRGADLYEANLYEANLHGADLRYAIFCDTKMPDGSINNDDC